MFIYIPKNEKEGVYVNPRSIAVFGDYYVVIDNYSLIKTLLTKEQIKEEIDRIPPASPTDANDAKGGSE